MRAAGVTLDLGGVRILERVDAVFARGRVTALLGPNGAGKSTLLHVLAGLRRPDAGTVTLDGVAIAALAPRDRARRIGLLPQTAEVHWQVDARSLVGLGRFAHRDENSATGSAAIDAAMVATDTAYLRDRVVDSLSGGELGRVLLARVLAGQPEWILADEPLASLDPAHGLAMCARLRDAAAAGAGVVAVLHDLGLAARFADDAVLIAQGRVVAAGPVADVLTPATIAQTFGVTAHFAEIDGVRTIIGLSPIDGATGASRAAMVVKSDLGDVP